MYYEKIKNENRIEMPVMEDLGGIVIAKYRNTPCIICKKCGAFKRLSNQFFNGQKRDAVIHEMKTHYLQCYKCDHKNWAVEFDYGYDGYEGVLKICKDCQIKLSQLSFDRLSRKEKKDLCEYIYKKYKSLVIEDEVFQGFNHKKDEK